MKNNYYAIETVKAGSGKVYVIRKVFGTILFPVPVDGRINFETLEEAIKAAEKAGITVSRIGDVWHII